MEEENIVSEMTVQKSKIVTARNTLEGQVPVGKYDGTFMEDFFEEVIFDLRSERQTSITKVRDSIGNFKGVETAWQQHMQTSSGAKRHGMFEKLQVRKQGL